MIFFQPDCWNAKSGYCWLQLSSSYQSNAYIHKIDNDWLLKFQCNWIQIQMRGEYFSGFCCQKWFHHKSLCERVIINDMASVTMNSNEFVWKCCTQKNSIKYEWANCLRNWITWLIMVMRAILHSKCEMLSSPFRWPRTLWSSFSKECSIVICRSESLHKFNNFMKERWLSERRKFTVHCVIHVFLPWNPNHSSYHFILSKVWC